MDRYLPARTGSRCARLTRDGPTERIGPASCDAWRTYGDARAYAYRPGGHATAMRRDRAGEHHRTEWFPRLRPLEERGALDGAAPFAGLLEPAPLLA